MFVKNGTSPVVINTHKAGLAPQGLQTVALLPPIPPPYASEDYYEDPEADVSQATKGAGLNSFPGWQQDGLNDEFLVDL